MQVCRPILVGVAFPVLEILLLLNLAKFPIWIMDHGSELAQKVMRTQNVSHSSLLVNYGIHFEFVNYGI